jgi:integrase/recombinase XerC
MDWLRSLGRSSNTIEARIRFLIRLNAWLQEQEIPRSLMTATADDLATWQRTISTMAVESIANYVGHARGFYAWLARFHHVPDASDLLERPRVPRRMPRPIDDQSLAEALRLADDRMQVMLALMAFAGARCCEVALAERPHLRDRAATPTIILYGKGGKQRIVRAPNDLGPMIDRIGVPARGRMVRTAAGHPLTATRVSQLVNAYLHSIGIPDTAHTIRHWYATNIYRITRDLRLVQEMLGHESPATTAIYTAYDPANADIMAAALGEKMTDMLGNGPRLRLVP